MNRNIRYSNIGLTSLLLIASSSASAQAVVEYLHTDALGTPVAVTDSNRVVIERSEYEPYGRRLSPAPDDRVGFTGHVEDYNTNLTYMQQRYYDADVGQFLSIDPVGPYDSPVTQFNRYRYGSNNPYLFKDPDGRTVCKLDRKDCPLPEVPTGMKASSIPITGQLVVDRRNPVMDMTVPRKNSPRNYADGRYSPEGAYRTKRNEQGKLVPRPHKGTDLMGPNGTDVSAISSGRVTFAGTKTGFGNTVIVGVEQGGEKFENLYGHLSSISVEEGQQVTIGDIIGVVGEGGLARGVPHLHIEVSEGQWTPSAPRVDPVKWIDSGSKMILDFGKP